MSDATSLEQQPGGRVWAGVFAAGVAAALVVPSGPPGIGLVLVGAGIAAAVAAARPRPLDFDAIAFTVAALVLLSMAAVFDAPWLIFVDLVAAMGCSAVAIAGARTWGTILSAPLRVLGQSLRVPAVVARALPRDDRVAPGVAARALGASAFLLVTFGALFSSADAAFARIAADVLLPDLGAGLLPARVTVGLLVVAGAGGLILLGHRRAALAGSEAAPSAAGDFWNRPFSAAPWRGRERGPRVVSPIEWAVPLGLLDLLFAAFVVVQLTVLFGGHRHVLATTGLTYAEYARQGFFQLVVIAVLVLGVVAVSWKAARGSGREGLLKGLLGVLCLLTLVVLASALRRMDVYEAAYGLTRIRVAVYAVDLWLAGLFALVMAAGAVGRAPWLPRAVLVLSVAGLLAFNVSNPDARIAQSGVERWRATGDIDSYYLSTLSADGLGPLTELPARVRGCIVTAITEEARRAEGPWTSFNLSRARALDPTPPETPCIRY